MSAPAEPDLAQSWLELPDGGHFWLKGRCAIGRQHGNDLAFPLPSLSRSHALLTATPSGYALTDLHSSNGTYLNRQLVTRAASLKDGDEIQCGELVLRYRCTRSSEITAASASQNVTHRLDDVRPHDCWLLVADVEGFAALNGQLGSEAALRRLQAWITEARPLLEKNGACINGYVGDAIFAYWRCDVAQPAQVLAALRALEAWRPRSPLPFRMVAHRGNALFTKSDRGEELTGQDVNFVFRSEKIAKGFGASAMLSEAAVESLGLAGCCDSYGGSAIDGMGDFHVFHGLPRAWRDPAAPV